MTNEQCATTTPHTHMCCHTKRISWTAVIVGALVGVGLGFLLNLFSIAIGLSIVTMREGLATLAVGGFIGLIIGAIVSMFVGGFAAGYLGRPHCIKRNLGVLYGFTAWCLALIIMMLLASYMGRYVSAYSNFIINPGTTIVTTGNEVQAAVATNPTTPVDVETTTKTLTYSAFLVFVLFFIGALSSCFGGHFGMTCGCRDDND